MENNTTVITPVSSDQPENNSGDVGGVADADIREATKRLRTEALGIAQQDFGDLLGKRFSTINKWENRRACADLPVLWHMGRLAEQRQRPDLASVFRRAVFGEFAAQLGEGVPVTEIVEVAGTLKEIEQAVAREPRLARDVIAYIRWRTGAAEEDLRRIEKEFQQRERGY